MQELHGANGPGLEQDTYLSVLSRAPAQDVKSLAEAVLAQLGDIEVLVNRTGLVMLPYTDNAAGTVFHLGEVLVAEAHIRLDNGIEGYAMCLGRDHVQALAIAVLDAAISAHTMVNPIMAFVSQQAAQQLGEDELLLRAVEATRIEMQTF
jgi:alpha-D-ribose 1-methylphosphonate 5-triphosphate synthase subunit PhnG